MKAMILAAGRGGRMGALTDARPKPLLPVGDQTLIEYHLNSLAKIGVDEVIINVCFFAPLFSELLGDGARYGVRIHYSVEDEKDPLETGGGIYRAMSQLGDAPFIVANGDIWTDYPFEHFPSALEGMAHLVLIDNPAFRPKGDFTLQGARVVQGGGPRLTYAGLAVLHPQLFAGCSPGRFSIAPLYRKAIEAGQVTGEHYKGHWFDVGRPDRYYRLLEHVA